MIHDPHSKRTVILVVEDGSGPAPRISASQRLTSLVWWHAVMRRSISRIWR
jgi:hypothetical protein